MIIIIIIIIIIVFKVYAERKGPYELWQQLVRDVAEGNVVINFALIFCHRI